MNELFTVIGNLGFPIVLSMYLLVRIESKLDLLTNSIINLSDVISENSIENIKKE